MLGLDTSTRATAVGLMLADGTTLQARDDPEGEERPGHATRLLPLASRLLADAGLGWDELERIVVGIGPGTFTGLRVGVATARGLAQSLGVALVGVSSLRALAYAAYEHAADGAAGADGATGVLAVIDARRGEAFAAAYDGDVELVAAQALAPSALGELPKRAEARTGVRRWVALGDGAVRYRDKLEQPGVLVPEDSSALHRVDARAICGLGGRAQAGEQQVVPDYRRRPDAEIALEGAPS
ncbi:MAG TPA: tRNA (adenosine(37)-N6)-threonylcarbamoyltransferase complex dimerization subunit type 1 TsaB [Solirubrobacteraceae bacterium]|nr:tRNA (adenosine(37)-N6)-threonylcarbamoyltransferase complex dimerization subunit type 1 TsaB [Solirubrobacteraceae bacterium]